MDLFSFGPLLQARWWVKVNPPYTNWIDVVVGWRTALSVFALRATVEKSAQSVLAIALSVIVGMLRKECAINKKTVAYRAGERRNAE